MNKWKAVTSIILSSVMLIQNVTTTIAPEKQLITVVEAEEVTKDDISAEEPAVFNEETKAALDEFQEELFAMYEAYPTDEIADASAIQEDGEESEENEFQTKRLIVKSTEDFDSYGAVAVADGYRGFSILQYDSEEAAKKAYEKLEADASVEFVQTDRIVSVDDILLTDKNIFAENIGSATGSYMTESMKEKTSYRSWGSDTIHADTFNRMLLEEKENLPVIVVGVLDTGIEYSHPVFANRVIQNDKNYTSDGYPADDVYSYNNHGTATASIVVDLTLDNVLVKPYKVLGYNGKGSESAICAGWAEALEDDVDVINMSLSGDGKRAMEEEMARLSRIKDVPVVVTAGNTSLDTESRAPANIQDCITVSATNKDNGIASYSCTGDEVDFAAPGTSIGYATNNGGYTSGSGTSFAAPHVTAAIAMLLSYDETMTCEEILSTLIYYATDLGEEGFDQQYGNGLLNMDFTEMKPSVEAPKILKEAGNYDDTITVEIKAEEGQDIYYLLDDDMGKSVKYTGPITIDNSCTLIAYCMKDGVCSEKVNKWYCIGDTLMESACEISEDGIITKYNMNQSKVVIPSSVKGITVKGIQAQMSYVKELELPKTVKTFFNYTAGNIPNLQVIKVAEDNPYMTVADGVLYSKDMTTLIACPPKKTGDLVVPETVEIIDDTAFYNSSLSSLTLPENLTTIGELAFKHCAFTKLHLPKKVENIAKGALQGSGTKGLHEITVAEDNPYYKTIDGVLYSADTTRLLYYNRIKEATQYAVEANTRTIDCCAFTDNTYLTKLTIPKTVNEVEWIMADHSCTALTDVHFMGNMPDIIATCKRFGKKEEGTENQPFGNKDKVTLHYYNGAYGFGNAAAGFPKYSLSYKLTQENGEYQNSIKVVDAVIIECSYSSGDYVEKANSKTTQLWFDTANGTIKGVVSKTDWYAYSSLVIPASMEGVRVTGIGKEAFKSNSKLAKIQLPDTVEIIEDEAFYYCSSLRLQEFPKNLTYIGNKAFYNCSKLLTNDSYAKEILVLPDKVEYIGDQAFHNIYSLYQVVFPESIEYIGTSAFYQMSSYFAFVGCFMGDIPYIGANAFGSEKKGRICCYNAAKMPDETPETNYIIDRYDTSVDFTTRNEIIYKDEKAGITYAYHPFTRSLGYASKEENYATEITLPTEVSGYSVEVLEYQLINRMDKLENVIVPDSVVLIELYGLYMQKDNTVIEFLGDAPELMSANAFGPTDNMYNFHIWYHQDEEGFHSGNWTSWRTYLYAENRFQFVKDEVQGVTWKIDTYDENAISLAEGQPASVTVPSVVGEYQITKIADGGFNKCETLQSVVISEGINVVGEEAFYGCRKLETAILPDTVHTLGQRAFCECNGLKTIRLSKNLQAIDEYTFYYCKALESIEIPNQVKNIGDYAFGYCSKLSNITLMEGLEEIGSYVTMYSAEIKRIEIPSTVKTIGSKAFGYKNYSSKVDGFVVAGYGETGAARTYADGNGLTYENLGTPAGGTSAATQIAFSNENTLIEVTAQAFHTEQYLTPEVTVICSGQALTVKKDYSLMYMNNVELGHGYVVIMGNGNYSGILTKTFEIIGDTTAVTKYAGEVIWKDNNNHLELRPENVTANLYKDNQFYASQKVSGSGTQWDYMFTQLEKYTADGKGYRNYSSQLSEVSGYEMTVDGATVTYSAKPITGEAAGIYWELNCDGHLYVTGDAASITADAVSVTDDAVSTGNYAASVMEAADEAPYPWLKYADKILTAEIGIANMTDASYLFKDCVNMTKLDTTNWDTGKISNLSHTFENCAKLSCELTLETTPAAITDCFKGAATNKNAKIVVDCGEKITREDAIALVRTRSAGCNVHLKNLMVLDVDDVEVILEKESFYYTGKAIEPKVTVKYNDIILIEHTDYELQFENNVKIGTAVITIEGINGYDFKATKEYKIVEKPVPSPSPSVKPSQRPETSVNPSYVPDESFSPSQKPGESLSTDASAAPSRKPSSSENPMPIGSVEPSVSQNPDSGNDIMKGDVDGDKEITLSDAQLVLKAALKIITLESPYTEAADVDEDGEIALSDAQQILKFALKIINKFTMAK